MKLIQKRHEQASPSWMSRLLREMPKSRHTWGHRFAVRETATNRKRSSMTELSLHGINTLRKKPSRVAQNSRIIDQIRAFLFEDAIDQTGSTEW